MYIAIKMMTYKNKKNKRVKARAATKIQSAARMFLCQRLYTQGLLAISNLYITIKRRSERLMKILEYERNLVIIQNNLCMYQNHFGFIGTVVKYVTLPIHYFPTTRPMIPAIAHCMYYIAITHLGMMRRINTNYFAEKDVTDTVRAFFKPCTTISNTILTSITTTMMLND